MGLSCCSADHPKVDDGEVLRLLTLTQEEVDQIVKEFEDALEKMEGLTENSPLKQIPLEPALDFYRNHSKGRGGNFNRAQLAEATAALVKQAQVPLAAPALQEVSRLLFETLDIDKSGEVSVGEWSCGLPWFFGEDEGGEDDRAADTAIFKVIDADGNGELSKEELAAYLLPTVQLYISTKRPDHAALRTLLQAAVVERVFTASDTNKDGKVSPEEWFAWMEKHTVTGVIEAALQAMVKPQQNNA